MVSREFCKTETGEKPDAQQAAGEERNAGRPIAFHYDIARLSEPTQLQLDIVGGLETVVGVLGEASGNDVVQSGRRRWPDGADGRRLFMQNGGSDRYVRLALEGPFPRGHLIEHRAECEKVAA